MSQLTGSSTYRTDALISKHALPRPTLLFSSLLPTMPLSCWHVATGPSHSASWRRRFEGGETGASWVLPGPTSSLRDLSISKGGPTQVTEKCAPLTYWLAIGYSATRFFGLRSFFKFKITESLG